MQTLFRYKHHIFEVRCILETAKQSAVHLEYKIISLFYITFTFHTNMERGERRPSGKCI